MNKLTVVLITCERDSTESLPLAYSFCLSITFALEIESDAPSGTTLCDRQERRSNVGSGHANYIGVVGLAGYPSQPLAPA